MSPPTKREASFVQHLRNRAGDRGAMAALRRGLGKRPGEAAEVYPYIAPFLRADASAAEERAYHLMATLFAFYHQGGREATTAPPGNLGASFDRLAQQVDSASVERRFVALLNCHGDDLLQHLRHAVSLLKGKDIPIDWEQLLADIRWWGREDRRAQRQWARAFWGGRAPGAPETGADSTGAAEAEESEPSDDEAEEE